MGKQNEDDYYEYVDGGQAPKYESEAGLTRSQTMIPTEQLSGDENDEKEGVSSVIFSVAQMKEGKTYKPFYGAITVMKSVVGSGILGLPYVVANFGPILSVIMFVAVYIWTQFACVLLLRAKNLSGHSNYTTIARSIMGEKGKILVCFTVIFCNVGVCMAEMIVFGDTFRNILENTLDKNNKALEEWYTSFEMLVLYVALAMSPFMFLKSIDKLRHVSLLAILAIFSFTALSIYNFIHIFVTDENPPTIYLWPKKFEIWKALGSLPTVLLAYSYQFNFFPIYKAIEKTNDQKMSMISLGGLTASMLLYILVGISGSFSYSADEIQSDFLISLQKDRIGLPLFLAMNISFVISTTFSMPIMFFGARNNFLSLIQLIRKFFHDRAEKLKGRDRSSSEHITIYRQNLIKDQMSINSQQEIGNFEDVLKVQYESKEKLRKEQEQESSTSDHPSNKQKNKNKLHTADDQNKDKPKKYDPKIKGIPFYIIVFIFYAVIVTVAIVVKDLGVIFNIVGALVSNMIGSIFPAIFYIAHAENKKLFYILAWILLICTSVLGILCVVAQQIYTYT